VEQAWAAARENPQEPQAWLLLGMLEAGASNDTAAKEHLEHALSLEPKPADAADAHAYLGEIWLRQNEHGTALHHIDQALAADPSHIHAQRYKARYLIDAGRFEEAIDIYQHLLKQDPEGKYVYWSELGRISFGQNRLGEALEYYRKAAALNPKDSTPLAVILTILHYMPEKTIDEIIMACQDWGSRFVQDNGRQRPRPSDLDPARRLRIGLFSDGFRQHPVGAMTSTALVELSRMGVDLHFYTTRSIADDITQRLMAVAKSWTAITRMSETQFAQRVREDGIDILIDLAGHMQGSQMQAMALEPAPVLVKWVGGLINTTGVKAIDYLITDSVESPPGSDTLYTEKLIRMPDDYICYTPPEQIPNVDRLPATENGYITFACFNNPTKINNVVLAEWAKLLHALPGSRLFLKGKAYGNEEYRRRTLDVLQGQGIDAERVTLEGQSNHYALLCCYNQVDIALDPWPYSGGLTTCEAMLMGVPVITLPGPTFAGRHSATHLANAGLPELVVEDWEQYRAQAIALASNLDTLATIRQHLREILLQSPVCNPHKFARHLSDALRAIWQRYCAGKPRASLAFTAEGQPWFEDEEAPTPLTHPAPEPDIPAPASEAPALADFDFQLQGKIMALDHGGLQVATSMMERLGALQALTTIVLDPSGTLQNVEALKAGHRLHLYNSHVALGNGEQGMFYRCKDPAWNSTLAPLPLPDLPPPLREPTSVQASHPIGTIRLDDIGGLRTLDWLLVSGAHDNLAILEGGANLLDQVLIVQVQELFAQVYQGQPSRGRIARQLAKHGLRLLRLDRQHVDEASGLLLSADAIFIPDETRLSVMPAAQRQKLAFLLHTAYQAHDAAWSVLASVDAAAAQHYLSEYSISHGTR